MRNEGQKRWNREERGEGRREKRIQAPSIMQHLCANNRTCNRLQLVQLASLKTVRNEHEWTGHIFGV